MHGESPRRSGFVLSCLSEALGGGEAVNGFEDDVATVRWTRIILGTMMALATCSCVWLFVRQSAATDSVSGLARHYGVGTEVVEGVARAYGVDPESVGSYGERPFPINYIEHELGWAWDQTQHPILYRSDIDALVTGYMSRCDLEDTITLYLFYSDWLSPKTLFHGEALPMEVSYQLDPSQEGVRSDQIVQYITFHDLGDNSSGWTWAPIAPICVPQARH